MWMRTVCILMSQADKKTTTIRRFVLSDSWRLTIATLLQQGLTTAQNDAYEICHTNTPCSINTTYINHHDCFRWCPSSTGACVYRITLGQENLSGWCSCVLQPDVFFLLCRQHRKRCNEKWLYNPQFTVESVTYNTF